MALIRVAFALSKAVEADGWAEWRVWLMVLVLSGAVTFLERRFVPAKSH